VTVIPFQGADPRGRFAINSVSSMILTAANMITAFLLTPFLIKNLGLEAYGIVQLSIQVTSFAGIAFAALQGSQRRHMTVLLQEENRVSAGRVLGAATTATLIASLPLVPLFTLVAEKSSFLFNVPPALGGEARILFVCGIVSLAIGALGSSQAAVLGARNRLDLENVLALIGLAVRLALILAVLSNSKAQARVVGYALMADRSVFLLCAIAMRRRIEPRLRIRLVHDDRASWRILAPLGSWLLADQIGVILLLHSELLLANRLLGAAAGGEYAALLQMILPIRAISGILTGALVPVIAILYARKDVTALVSSVEGAMRLLGLVLALPVGLLCGLGPEILECWLGAGFSRLWPLLFVLAFHQPLSLSVSPSISLAIAMDRFKAPALATILAGAANIVLALVLASFTGLGSLGIAIAAVVTLTVKNLAFNAPYTDGLLGIPRGRIALALLRPLLWTSLASLLSWIAGRAVRLGSWVSLAAAALAVCVVYLPAAWFLGLGRADRLRVMARLGVAQRRVS
jgi:O-antigen/teichoic acid export membrane protein